MGSLNWLTIMLARIAYPNFPSVREALMMTMDWGLKSESSIDTP